MGMYTIKYGEKYNGKNVWLQDRKAFKIYYSKPGGWWSIHPKPAEDRASITTNRAKKNHPSDVTQWFYIGRKDGVWLRDPTLTIKRGGVPRYHHTIVIESKGGAKGKYSSLMGVYLDTERKIYMR